MRYLLPCLAIVLALFVSCETITPGTPVVTATPITGGDTLRLTWVAISGADGYNVYLDGTKYQVTSGTSYDVGTPTKLIEVSSYTGSEESDRWSLNTGIVKTTSVSVDNMGGSGANKAFYFNTSGTAVAIPYASSSSDIDFVLDTTGISTELRGPTSYDPDINSKDNASASAGTTDFDSYSDAPGGGVYSTVNTISSGAVYALWIDQSPVGWGSEDHFAKMKVENISGNTATLTFGYQKVGGLRWLRNP